MNQIHIFHSPLGLAFAIVLATLVACTPFRTQSVTKPTLDEVRLGRVAGAPALDLALATGEIRGEVLRVDPTARALQVRTDDGRSEILLYDLERTRVLYHGSNYTPANLQAGDIIAFQPLKRDKEIDRIRLQQPVQARVERPIAGSLSPTPRVDLVEGTVDRIQYERGVFDLNVRGSGRTVTVSLPFNATAAEIENFRRLRPGDYVRIEGEFVNPETIQIVSFMPRTR